MGITGLVALLAIMGLISGMIGESRGNGFSGSFILGFILGPIGMLIAALSTPASKKLPAPGGPAADWYPDPTHRHEKRYWDGYRWTQHVADMGAQATDRL